MEDDLATMPDHHHATWHRTCRNRIVHQLGDRCEVRCGSRIGRRRRGRGSRIWRQRSRGNRNWRRRCLRAVPHRCVRCIATRGSRREDKRDNSNSNCFSHRWHRHLVRAPGLRTEFPSLRGVDSNPGNLRPAITSLIGRDAEVSNLQAALRSHRLVTLAGVGGVGKTRLALEVATQLADEFVDGVWFFELAAVADPAAVPDAVAAVLGITQQPGKSVGESVASALEGRSRLLVFDNCEHVVDSVADLVAAILAASATVKVLATSREGIGVADEKLWRVPSLDVGAAVELFVESAQSKVLGPLADEATAVADVCRRLDGIPLAIELAASRMASMTAAEVRDRLDDRFKLLVGSRRGLERHQTLRHAVAWSYDLLDDTDKSLLAHCSVFAGGFDLESACAVTGSDDEFATLELLDALLRKSLIIADRSTGRTRFSMLET